jgi:hypothetical protein
LQTLIRKLDWRWIDDCHRSRIFGSRRFYSLRFHHLQKQIKASPYKSNAPWYSSKFDLLESILESHRSRSFQIGLIVLAMLVTHSSATSLQAKLGLPRGNQVVGWVVLGESIGFDPWTRVTNNCQSCRFSCPWYIGYSLTATTCIALQSSS